MTQDEMKTLVGQAALDYVQDGQIIGVGTGSTVNKFIEALGTVKSRIAGAVSSSEASTRLLQALDIPVFAANAVEKLALYVDGADEIDGSGYMIKGGGAALTREKIVASMADTFLCIADVSKRVDCLGAFALPVEVIPMAADAIRRRFAAMGGQATLRTTNGAADGPALVTDNGQHILDVRGLRIKDPLAFENETNQWPGVVTVGVFAHQKAHICLLGSSAGVERIDFRGKLRASA